MTITGLTIVNEAIQLIGNNQPAVTGSPPTFDSSPAGVAAAALYQSVVNTVARQANWDWTRQTVTLTASGNTPPLPFTYEYLYPANAVQVWQVIPASLSDANNPLPITWQVANTMVGGNQTKVVQTNQASASAVVATVLTNSEPLWDPLFRQAVVRLLASEMAMACEARPDTAREMLETSVQFAQVGATRDS